MYKTPVILKAGLAFAMLGYSHIDDVYDQKAGPFSYKTIKSEIFFLKENLNYNTLSSYSLTTAALC